jgi:hypothetical protein
VDFLRHGSQQTIFFTIPLKLYLQQKINAVKKPYRLEQKIGYLSAHQNSRSDHPIIANRDTENFS